MSGIYWLASYPKSGNTWFRAVLQNFETDGTEPVEINALETGAIASSRMWLDDVIGIDTADLTDDEIFRIRHMVYRWKLAAEDVGYHKIHDAYGYTPEGEPMVSREGTLGAVYIIRNPLDVAPSYANHNQSTIDKAIACMGDPGHCLSSNRKRLTTQVRQILGTWSSHVLSWVDAPGLNLCIIRYEDMQANTEATFGRAFRFLGLPDDPDRLRKALGFSSFERLSAQEAESGFKEKPPGVKNFFRRGKVGDWRTSLSDEQVSRIITDHGDVMRRFGYLTPDGEPV